LTKTQRGPLTGRFPDADGQDPAVSGADEPAVAGLALAVPAQADTASTIALITEPPLQRRQPKTAPARTDWQPVDLVVLRKVLDALNERRPLAVKPPSPSRRGSFATGTPNCERLGSRPETE